MPKRPSLSAVLRAAGLSTVTSAHEAFVAARFAGRKTVTNKEAQAILADLLAAVFNGDFDPQPEGFVPAADETLTYCECADLLEEAVESLSPADQGVFDDRFEDFVHDVWWNDDSTVNADAFAYWIDAQFDLWHAGKGGFEGPAPETVEVEVEYEYDADDEPELIAACLPELSRLTKAVILAETARASNLLRSHRTYGNLSRRHLACLATTGDTLAFEWLEASRPTVFAVPC